jgi:predicted RNA binding protein YcfA (HicA-like mRNA interferase family)
VPVRAAKITKALKKMGIEHELIEPSRGSHWVLECNGKAYILPLHNGPKTEVSDVYIRGLCRNFSIDEKELRSHL